MSLHRQGKVLVVEDDGPAREALRQVFIERDFAVDFASTATDAVAMIGRGQYAAVVLDSRLRDGEPWSVLDMLRHRAIPVVVMVGMGDEHAAVAAYQLGAAECFVKGSGLTALLPNMVARAIERASAQQQWREAESRRHQQLIQVPQIDSAGGLTGGIAHDFNNLLTGILGFCSLAMRQLGKDHQTYQSLEEIERAAGRAAHLVSQLLADSRCQVGGSEPLDLKDKPTVSGPARQVLDPAPAPLWEDKSADAEDKEYLCSQV